MTTSIIPSAIRRIRLSGKTSTKNTGGSPSPLVGIQWRRSISNGVERRSNLGALPNLERSLKHSSSPSSRRLHRISTFSLVTSPSIPHTSRTLALLQHQRRAEHTQSNSSPRPTSSSSTTESKSSSQKDSPAASPLIPEESTPVKHAAQPRTTSTLSPSDNVSNTSAEESSSTTSQSSDSTSTSPSSSSTSVTAATHANASTSSTSLLTRILPSSILNPKSNSETSIAGEKEKEEGSATSSIWKLVDLARPEKQSLGIAIGLLFISSGVSMLVPLTIGKLIDFFSNSETNTFFGMSFPVAATLLALTFALGALANTGRAILMRLSGQRIIARVRNQAYLGTLKQEPEFADRGAGDIVSRLGIDTGIVGDSVTSNLSDGLRAIISAVVGVAAMFMISAKLTGVMLAVVPPVSIGAVIYGRYLRKLSNQTQEALGEMSKTAEEKLNAFKTVTAFNAQPIEGELFATKVDTVFQLARKEAIASGIFFGGSGLTGNLTMLCLLGFGGHLVSKGDISVGDLTSLLIYTGYVGGSVSGLTGFWTGLMKGVGAGTRVFHLLDRQSAIPMGVGRICPKDKIGEIRLEKVSFRYPSRKEVSVLDDVTLRIEVGKSVAIVGPSGSGKSSIQALLTRFYDPDEGRVLFDGEDIRDFTPESWRARIGIVPQDPVLFSGTVHENIAYGLTTATRKQVEEAARQANCDFIWSLPQKFDTPIGKASLSGGQKQRIAVARALVRQPSILLLDEASSALDSGSEAAVNASINSIMRQHHITVILVAHRLSSIAQAEKVIVLEGGKITEEGLYRDLSRREGSRFRSLMAAQLLLEKTKSGSASSAKSEIKQSGEETSEKV